MARIEVPIVVDMDGIKAYLEQNDVVEVTRCKDCKWCRTYYHGENMPFSYGCSKLMLSSIQSTSYCSFAEPKVPQKRCGNCKFLTYRWGKVWCDIRCENPTVDVCDKWKRSE